MKRAQKSQNLWHGHKLWARMLQCKHVSCGKYASNKCEQARVSFESAAPSSADLAQHCRHLHGQLCSRSPLPIAKGGSKRITTGLNPAHSPADLAPHGCCHRQHHGSWSPRAQRLNPLQLHTPRLILHLTAAATVSTMAPGHNESITEDGRKSTAAEFTQHCCHPHNRHRSRSPQIHHQGWQQGGI